MKSEEEVMADYKLFTEKYEKKIKEFGLFSKMDDSQRFFIENPNLCCEHTGEFFVDKNVKGNTDEEEE